MKLKQSRGLPSLLPKHYEGLGPKFWKDDESMLLAATSISGSSERHEPKRTCVVCREGGGSGQFIELGLIGNDVVLTPVSKGRGAWVCATRQCLEKLDNRVLARAFKASVSMDAIGDPVAFCRDLASRRLLESLGLARRQGVVEIGVEPTARALSRGEEGVAVMANDLSERSTRQLEGGTVVGNSEFMGRAMGLKRAGAAWIPAGAMAEKAALWAGLVRELGLPEQNDEVV